MALQSCKMYVPEIPGSVIEFYPQFIQGSQMVLWGRQDFMNRFDVMIQESKQAFTITSVDPAEPVPAAPGFSPAS